MEIIINGSSRSGEFGNVAELLQQEDLTPQTVVVELNGKILPAADYATTRLQNGDTVEIVQFVAGG